jgi:hypothetical protein
MSNPVVIHSKLSFSGRDRWRACPISVQLSAGMPDKSGPAAAEGTAAHTVGEWYVRQLGEAYGLPPVNPPMMGEAPVQLFPEGFDPKGKTLEQWNEELRTHGKAYRAFILSLIPAGEQAFVSLEQKVRAKSISEHLFGTADCLIWLPRLRKLIVVDYKYGFVEVEIGEFDAAGKLIHANAQLSAYAVAALDQCTLDANAITLAVYQPRRTFGKPEQILDLPVTWIAQERAKLAAEVAAVEAGGAPNPGDHCRYCKGKSKCQPVHNALAAGIQAHSGALDLLAIPKDDLITLWAAKAAFKAFWEDVEELIEREVKAGNPRLTVKETQGRQMWADPQAAALTLMALGKTDLLAPCKVSDALPHLPEDWQKQLIRRSQPSRSIQLVTPVAPAQVAETFAKYAKPVDKA